MPKRQRGKDEGSGPKRQFLGRYSICRVANRSKVKRVVLERVGELVPRPLWFNSGYIYPLDYCAQVEYKDILNPNIKIPYCCQIEDNDSELVWSTTLPIEAKRVIPLRLKSASCCNDSSTSMLRGGSNIPILKSDVGVPDSSGARLSIFRTIQPRSRN